MTYARTRLLLGVTTVGSLVTLSTLALSLDLPARTLATSGSSFVHEAALTGLVIAVYAAIHVPFDLLGGLILPGRFGRLKITPSRVLPVLIRGAALHALVLWFTAIVLLTFARLLGLTGVVMASAGLTVVMLAGRSVLARSIGGMRPTPSDPNRWESDDTGFTGGIEGFLTPGQILTPSSWHDRFDSDQLDRALARRRAAIATGSWARGQAFAIAFTLLGVAFAGWMAGADSLGTAAGLTTIALWFTLWSFAGLLTLPTLSRWAVAHADRQAGNVPQVADTLVEIEQLGDGELRRPAWIETIFHPVPSVSNRLDTARPNRPAFWDVARTSLYLGAAGLGFLGRAVHCNCGRPALWVYLPSA